MNSDFSKTNWQYTRFFFWPKVFNNRRELYTGYRVSSNLCQNHKKIEHASLLSLLTEKEKLVSQSFIQKHGGFFIISVFPIKISRKTTFLSLNIKNGPDAGITGICIRPSEAEATVLCSDTQKNVNYHCQLELSAFISAL